jgi:hypothetical protein
MKLSTFAAIAALLFSFAVPAVHADNIVVNGGFETGDFSGWTVTNGGAFTLVDSKYNLGGFGAHTGSSYAALGAVEHLGSVSQTLATTPGQAYTLGFFLASDGFTPNQLKVDWDGTTVFDLSNLPRQGYTEFKIPVLATGASTTLTFFERNDPGYLSLDDVSVSSSDQVRGSGGTPPPSPEPGSLTLLALGALGIGLGGLRYRRRRA